MRIFSSSLHCKPRKEKKISAEKQQRNHNCWLWQTLLTFEFLFWRLVRRVVVCFTPLSPLVSIPSLPRVARLSISFAPIPKPTPKGGGGGRTQTFPRLHPSLPPSLPPSADSPTNPSPPNERKGEGGGELPLQQNADEKEEGKGLTCFPTFSEKKKHCVNKVTVSSPASLAYWAEVEGLA